VRHATGLTPTVVTGTPHAVADGALLAAGQHAAPDGTAATARLPRTRLRAADLTGVGILTGCSALLLWQAVATAWTQGAAGRITAVYLASEQVAAAAAVAAVAALAVAHLAPTVWLSGTPPDPATEPTTGSLIRNAYLTAGLLGAAVAGLQGLAAGIPYGRTYLGPALTAALPIAVCALLIAAAAPRIRTSVLPAWQARTRPPVAWIALATVGIALMRAALSAGFPTNLIGMHTLVGATGALCLGVGTVLTVASQPLIRLVTAPILGLGYAAVYSVTTVPALTIGYIIALGWWTLALTTHTLRLAFPNTAAGFRRLVDGAAQR
jgi:hypothetical protein